MTRRMRVGLGLWIGLCGAAVALAQDQPESQPSLVVESLAPLLASWIESLPQSMIRFGHASAVTLVDVIVFEEGSTALEDPKFWAHELKHVMQFEQWGVDGFAMRYLSDYAAVETEANDFRWQFMKQAGLIPEVRSPDQ